MRKPSANYLKMIKLSVNEKKISLIIDCEEHITTNEALSTAMSLEKEIKNKTGNTINTQYSYFNIQ